ncbi:hypothetical protein PoB_004757400, partial [Plakobranchus ocellatus]
IVHNKVISGFQTLRQDRVPVAGLEPVTEESLQITGRIGYPLCYRRLPHKTFSNDTRGIPVGRLEGKEETQFVKTKRKPM